MQWQFDKKEEKPVVTRVTHKDLQAETEYWKTTWSEGKACKDEYTKNTKWKTKRM